MTMRTVTKLSIFLPLAYLSGFAVAGDKDMQEPFRSSVETGCAKELIKRAIADYSKMTGIGSDNVSAGVQAKLEEVVRPLYASCNCLARKASMKVESKSERKMEIAVDLSGFSDAAECAAEPATSSAVQRNFMRLIEASPPAASSLKTKRTPFTVDLTLSKGRPSVFASYTRPPESLTRLVFLAPGTGIACTRRNICIDKAPLEIEKAKELLGSHGRVLGKEGSRNLQKVIEQFGEDSRIVTSGSNFTNFVTTQQKGGVSYVIQSIDGIPIERTTEMKVWLVIFASQVPVDPRALDFAPAIASVVEVEFAE